MHRVKLLATSLALASLVAATMAAPAGAQGYTGWIEHPYPSAGLWYCDWYGDTYYCQGNGGTWFPDNPDWYNLTSDEMMRVNGQPVL